MFKIEKYLNSKKFKVSIFEKIIFKNVIKIKPFGF
jgi:hypothetical protein